MEFQHRVTAQAKAQRVRAHFWGQMTKAKGLDVGCRMRCSKG